MFPEPLLTRDPSQSRLESLFQIHPIMLIRYKCSIYTCVRTYDMLFVCTHHPTLFTCNLKAGRDFVPDHSRVKFYPRLHQVEVPI